MAVYSLSGIQRQFWTASKMHPESSAYNIASWVRIDGDLDTQQLRHAWRQVFDSAEIFNMSFPEIDGKPVACAGNSVEAPWQEFSCTQDEVFKVVSPVFYGRFDLETAPLVRAALIEVSQQRHYFILVQHHIVTDLYSKKKVTDAISGIYNQVEATLSARPYSAFTEIEKDFLANGKGVTSLAFWKRKMADCPGALELPCEKGHQTIFRGKGSSLGWQLPFPLAKALEAKEKANQGQPFLWLLTAYIAFLSRISGQNNLAVGVPLTNRRLDGASSTLGPFVNMLPVFATIAPEDSFISLYGKVRKEMLLNHRHQEIPFYDIAGYYKGKREPSRPYLIQAGFTSEPLFELHLNGLECTSLAIEKRGAQMDLFFTYWPTREGYSGCWEYNSDLMSAALVREWQDAFNTLVQDSLEKPESPLDRYQFISPAAKSRHDQWNETTKQYPLDENLALQLRNAFSEHRDEVALVYGEHRENLREDHQFSYGEMEKIVCRTASRLHREFGEKNRIALLLSQSPEMVFAIHGIIQSGNAYVPIGTDWPQERIRMVLEDIGPAAVIAERKYDDMLSLLGIPVIQAGSLVEDDDDNEETTYPELDIGPQDSAYIIYTSGSTGKPKGAELPHKGVLNRVLWMQDEYRLSRQDRVLQKTPYTFDVSVWEFLWPFFTGAGLVVTKPDGNRDPHYLKEIIDEKQVSVLHFVPSMLPIFLNVPGVGELSSVRDVICSGEALTKGQEEKFFNTFKKARLHNLYGPTEASIDVTSWECGRDSEKDCPVVPIGKPIANTQLYIVDENGCLCPPFVTGELLIGGVGLAKGYWNRTELTREKFIPNPFGAGRLYRTGDLARYRMDGVIEYIGRSDFQVKIRGLRVELGEVEKSLEAHGSVEKAVVSLWQRVAGDERLVAYYTCPEQETVPMEDELKSYLRVLLPEYMVPSHFVLLSQMPLNPNGKLDRKALPLPGVDVKRMNFLAPENEIQRRIHRLWEEVLSSENFGIDDNFFDVGGHSLTLMGLCLKLEKTFGLKIEIMDLFRYPSVKGMAALVGREAVPANESQKARAMAQRKRLHSLATRKR